MGAGGAAPASGSPRTTVFGVPEEIPIRDETIRLGQLLKLAGVAESGADAKALLAEGAVTVSGEVETRRGRQVRAGDVVVAGGEELRVV